MKIITKNQTKQIQALKRIKEEDIDFTDIPEKKDWSSAVVEKFYRPIKKSLTISVKRTDGYSRGLRRQGKGYQTLINSYLRRAMESAHKKT